MGTEALGRKRTTNDEKRKVDGAFTTVRHGDLDDTLGPVFVRNVVKEPRGAKGRESVHLLIAWFAA